MPRGTFCAWVPSRPHGLQHERAKISSGDPQVAAYTLIEEGSFKGEVRHLAGGLNAWFRQGLPGEGDEEWVASNRTPSAMGGPGSQ